MRSAWKRFARFAAKRKSKSKFPWNNGAERFRQDTIPVVIPDRAERKRLNHAIRDFNHYGHVTLREVHFAYLLLAERDDIALV